MSDKLSNESAVTTGEVGVDEMSVSLAPVLTGVGASAAAWVEYLATTASKSALDSTGATKCLLSGNCRILSTEKKQPSGKRLRMEETSSSLHPLTSPNDDKVKKMALLRDRSKRLGQ